MDSKSFIEFIQMPEEVVNGIVTNDNDNDTDDKREKRLSFVGGIPYNEGSYSPGSIGYYQLMDRLEFMIENWHSHICSHPVLKNPDPELNAVRNSVVEMAKFLFNTYNILGDIQYKRFDGKPGEVFNRLGVH